jgi:hypothetical protein
MTFNSKQYWEKRYTSGGNSGAGSYSILADFKSNIINQFIADNNIQSIIDYGVGDGNQLNLIDTSAKKYIGIDVSQKAIDICKDKFKNDLTKNFYLESKIETITSDLVLSCDVLYHLIEDEVYYKYLNRLFEFSNLFIIIYARDEDYNHTTHVKFRKFTPYLEIKFSNWKLIKHIPNKYPQNIIGKDNSITSPSDFYIYKKIN